MPTIYDYERECDEIDEIMKTQKEFNLSEKRTLSLGVLKNKVYGYPEEDVKEALKKFIEYCKRTYPLNDSQLIGLKKIFGDRLF